MTDGHFERPRNAGPEPERGEERRGQAEISLTKKVPTMPVSPEMPRPYRPSAAASTRAGSRGRGRGCCGRSSLQVVMWTVTPARSLLPVSSGHLQAVHLHGMTGDNGDPARMQEGLGFPQPFLCPKQNSLFREFERGVTCCQPSPLSDLRNATTSCRSDSASSSGMTVLSRCGF